MSGIDIIINALTEMKSDQLKIWEENCPYTSGQVSMYSFTVEHCIQEIEKQKHLEEFTLNFFNELFELAKTVYKEKPEINNFNEYVKGLILKDLEGGNEY